MKKAFYSSLFIHGLIFVFIFITLPKIKIKEIDYISVEIINEGVKKEEEKALVKEIKANKKTAIKVAPPKQKPKSTPKINEAVEIVMFYSPRTAKIFTDLALKYNLYTGNKVAICISDRCVSSVAKLKWKEIKVSSASNETKMLELI